MNSKIYIEYLDGTRKEICFDNVIRAFEEQREILKNKKLMKNIKVLKVV